MNSHASMLSFIGLAKLIKYTIGEKVHLVDPLDVLEKLIEENKDPGISS